MKNINLKNFTVHILKLLTALAVLVATLGGCALLNGGDRHDNFRPNASLLRIGESLKGSITLSNNQDWFRIEVPESGTLTVSSTGNTDATAELYDESGSLLTSNADNANDLSHSLPAGTYFIRLRGTPGSASGNYTIQADFISNESATEPDTPPDPSEPPTDPDTPPDPSEPPTEPDTPPDPSVIIEHGNTRERAIALSFGTPVNGAFQTRSNHWFSITLSEEGEVDIYTTGSVIPLEGTLFDSAGYPIYRGNYSGRLMNFRMNLRLAAGTYYIRVIGFWSATSNYTIHANFSATPSDPSVVTSVDRVGAPTISLGGVVRVIVSPNGIRYQRPPASLEGSVNASISPVGDYDWFKIETTEAGWVTLFSEGTTDTRAFLFDDSANILQENDDGASSHNARFDGRNFLIRQNLSAGSTYYLSVSELADNATGDYSVRALFIPSSASPAELRNLGGSLSGSIDSGDDTDWYSIVVTEAVTTMVVYSLGDTDIEGTLFSSDGLVTLDPVHVDDDDGPGYNFFIKQSVTPDTYHLRVRGWGGKTGDYNIHVHFVP